MFIMTQFFLKNKKKRCRVKRRNNRKCLGTSVNMVDVCTVDHLTLIPVHCSKKFYFTTNALQVI